MTAGLTLADTSWFDEVLKPVDGPRGTWSWMLNEGIHGHGLIPWIVDMDCWICSGRVFNRTLGAPVVTPVVAKWSVPSDHGNVFVELSEMVAPGGFNHNNTIMFEEEGDSLLVPIWAVTPINEVAYFRWKIALSQSYRQYSELLVMAYSCEGGVYHVEDCPSEELFSNECTCELSKLVENIADNVRNNDVCPPIYDDLVPAWEWGISRWVDGWSAIENKLTECELEDPYCLCSLLSQLSPWAATLPSERSAREKERLSSIPLMSSQQSLESWEKSSPQLTLFDM